MMARRMPTVNSVKEQADAELYFEMEFPGKDPDTISFSSKSIESFSSETTNPDSRYIALDNQLLQITMTTTLNALN